YALVLLDRLGYNEQSFWPLNLYLIVVNPLLEEMFWRGTVLNALESSFPDRKYIAYIWSSIAYAILHFTIFALVLSPFWAGAGTVGLIIYGALLACIYRQTGSVLTIAIAHGLITDTAVVCIMIDLLRRHATGM